MLCCMNGWEDKACLKNYCMKNLAVLLCSVKKTVT